MVNAATGYSSSLYGLERRNLFDAAAHGGTVVSPTEGPRTPEQSMHAHVLPQTVPRIPAVCANVFGSLPSEIAHGFINLESDC